MEALVRFHGAIPAVAEEIEGRFAVGGLLEEGEEVRAAGAEEAEVGACVGEGEEEGCCVEAVVAVVIGLGLRMGLGLRLVGSTCRYECRRREVWEGCYA